MSSPKIIIKHVTRLLLKSQSELFRNHFLHLKYNIYCVLDRVQYKIRVGAGRIQKGMNDRV